MKAKNLLIPVAAFALTVTGAQAFNSQALEDAGLSDDQIMALEQARELRQDGDRDGARDVLIEAGIDLETLETVRETMREHRTERRTAVHEAVESNDFDAFLEAVEGSPMADIVTSESDFVQFVEAYELRQAGEHKAAKEIMEDLGFEPKGLGHGRGHGPHSGFGPANHDGEANGPRFGQFGNH